MNNKKNSNTGQVALIVLLISAAVMTLGLSLSQKTIVDTKIETNEEQLKQAFNVAESGIEYYLGTGSTRFTTADNLSVANVQVSNVGLGSTINFNQYTLINKTQEYWLVGHSASGAIDYSTYYQGNSLGICLENSFLGSMKVDYFYMDSSSVIQVTRLGYNLTPGFVSGFSDLSPLPGTGSCRTGYRQVSLTTPFGGGIKPLLLAVKPMQSGVRMYLLGSGQNFPIQGIELTSTGRVGDISTGVNRKINVLKLYQVPSFFLDAITTYGSVLSN